MTGHPRESRGHRIVGPLCAKAPNEERHWIAAAAVVAAAVIAAGNQVASSRATATSQENLAEYQAETDARRARQAKDAGDAAAEDERQQNERLLASNRARQGASGLDPSYGAPLLAQIEGATQAATNVARIKYAGETQSSYYHTQSILDKFAGRVNARNTRREGYLAAGTTLLSAAPAGIKLGRELSKDDE